MFCQTESLYRSFFPATTREWNQLPTNIKESRSLGIFKNKIVTSLFPAKPHPWFYQGNSRFSNIHHCRIRNNCSALNFHLYINHVKDNPRCSYCTGNFIEDPSHYFLECQHFEVQRTQMTQELENYFLPPRITPNTLNDFLYGNETLPLNENMYLFKVVQTFILRTNRFK